MNNYPIYDLDSAPEQAKPALQALLKDFGFVPNLAGAMAGSKALLSAFAAVFQQVHTGSLSEAQIQVLLLSNAVTNASPWPVAFHSVLALAAGVSAADIAAIRQQKLPQDPKFGALSAFARAMIEKRGRVSEREQADFAAAGFTSEQVLELITVSAASTMTNYAAAIARPPLEERFQAQAWSNADREG